MNPWPDYAAFAECRGHQFTVRQEQGPLTVELSAVKQLAVDSVAVDSSNPSSGRAKPFALTFSGPPEPSLQQMTYQLEHPLLGELLIFLVPVGRQAGSMQYEAIFN